MGDQGQSWQAQAGGGQSTSGDTVPIDLPSGQSVTLIETIMNTPGPNGMVARFRFLAPQINPENGSVDLETASNDIAWLCQNYALARVAELGPMPSQIIVSLEDRAVPFGESDPEAVQFFEAFRIENGSCIWEVF